LVKKRKEPGAKFVKGRIGRRILKLSSKLRKDEEVFEQPKGVDVMEAVEIDKRFGKKKTVRKRGGGGRPLTGFEGGAEKDLITPT